MVISSSTPKSRVAIRGKQTFTKSLLDQSICVVRLSKIQLRHKYSDFLRRQKFQFNTHFVIFLRYLPNVIYLFPENWGPQSLGLPVSFLKMILLIHLVSKNICTGCYYFLLETFLHRLYFKTSLGSLAINALSKIKQTKPNQSR